MDNKPFPFSVCKECCATGGGSDINSDAIVSDVLLMDSMDGGYELSVIKLSGGGKPQSNMRLAPMQYVDENFEDIDLALKNKIDESRINKEPADIEETWSINIYGFAERAGRASRADADVFGQNITEIYFSEVGRENETEIYFNTPATPKMATISAASPKYVDDAIGDIETALENIIAKYGLGGDSV